MRITSALFSTAAVDERGWPKDGLPQIAFVGRSNVGKSSLINSLLNRKGLVRTSSTPGKTREINFFVINGKFYFVDLPGFGYARVPGRVQATWGPMIEKYLKGCPGLSLVVLLLDIRHEPGNHDKLVRGWLEENGLPTVYVATKADKISRGNRKKHMDMIARALPGLLPGDIVQYSAATGEGRDRLWDRVREAVNG